MYNPQDSEENRPRVANQEEDPYDYYDQIKETVDRIDYDLLYGEGDNEEDNTAYDYNTNTEDDYNTNDYNTEDDYNVITANDYGDYNEEDNTGDDYNDYNYDAGEFTTDEPTTEYPEDERAVIIGSVDTSEEVTGGPFGPRTTAEPGTYSQN